MMPDFSTRFNTLEDKVLENYRILVGLRENKNERFTPITNSNFAPNKIGNIILLICSLAALIFSTFYAPSIITGFILGGICVCVFPPISIFEAANRIFSSS